MDIKIKELQEAALNGDSTSLKEYNEYVKRGMAQPIVVREKPSMGQLELSQEDAQGNRPSLYGNLDPTKLHEVYETPYTLMAAGYNARKEERKHEAGEVTNFEGSKIDRNLSPLELMMNGYGEDGKAKNKEMAINPNDIKDGEK